MPSERHDSERYDVFEIIERVLFLKDVELFRNVDTEKLSIIAEIARERVFEKGDAVSEEGEAGEELYIIKSGALSILKEKDGLQYPLKHIGPGDCFGVFGIFGNRNRQAGATAKERTVVFEIRKDEFRKVLISNPEIAYNILEILSDRIYEMDNEIVLLNKTLNRYLTDKS